MKIINLVSGIQSFQIGMWGSAISTAKLLKEEYGIYSEIWYPESNNDKDIPDWITTVKLNTQNKLSQILQEKNLDPKTTIINSHGAWGISTKLGYKLAKKKFKWVHSTQGTLEPWALSQKKIKKVIYYNLFEKSMLEKVDIIRAVSTPEYKNLTSKFKNKKIVLIPNGIEKTYPSKAHSSKINVLFMARLHHKKGVFPLVKAWLDSELNNNVNANLYIAGPDQGELKLIQPLIDKSQNITYIGSIYAAEKEKWMNKCSYYILPSFSEGFPTSVLEAAGSGLIPIISDGCNFPELISNKLAIHISPQETDIKKGITTTLSQTIEMKNELSSKLLQFINNDYTLKSIAKKQKELYESLLF